MAYDTTTVTVQRSQEALRKLLRTAGADRIAFAEQLTGASPGVGVEFLHLGLLIRMVCPVREPDGATVRDKADRSRTKNRDDIRDEMLAQEERRVWRVLHWCIKTRLEAVDEGLETFEQSFLPHLVDPSTGRTIWDSVRGEIESGALKYHGGIGLGEVLELGPGDSR